jgi:hypothetical protein
MAVGTAQEHHGDGRVCRESRLRPRKFAADHAVGCIRYEATLDLSLFVRVGVLGAVGDAARTL